MLTPEILTALKSYTEGMKKSVSLVVQSGEHDKRAELIEFLTQIASVSDKINVIENDASDLRSPLSFRVDTDDVATGIVFSGIPSGHEFNSLILAILQSAGSEIKLDEGVKKIVAGIEESLSFEVFISLSCHNCPDVVQILNQFALLNPNISSEMIDGGLYADEITRRDIQGVPSVYLNGQVFANGKIDAAELVNKIVEKYPPVQNNHTHDARNDELVQDVCVVGGGPAGVSAAIYSARKGLKVTLIADRLGGQVKDTMGIENLIGVPKTTGQELTNALQSHLNDYDINVREHLRVSAISKGPIKSLTLSSGEIVKTKTVIIATGARWRELGVPGERENIGKGVAYCPHCDGPFFKNKDVAVIGGGNSGLEAALDLAGIVKSVTVFEFMPELKADQVLVDQVKQRDNIRVLKNVATTAIVSDHGKVTGLEYRDRTDDSMHKQTLAGVFVQIGLVPNSQSFVDVVETTAFGEIVINDRCETSAPGIFACGDVTTVPYKQIVISLGEGATASLSAFDYLLKNTNLGLETDCKTAA